MYIWIDRVLATWHDEWWLVAMCQHRRADIHRMRNVRWGMALRRVQILDTVSTKLKVCSFLRSVRWSKLRIGRRVQRGLYLLNKMLVITVSRVGRKERMWMRRKSGRVLIMSPPFLSALSILCFSLLLSIAQFCGVVWSVFGFYGNFLSE